MGIDEMKELIGKGDIPQASEQLREILAKTPEDAAARMLYGTCCQLMGDSATFGRIYRDLAPQMEPRVTRGERSELVSMWLKYAAMFAMLLMCGSQLWATEDYCATFDDDDAQAAVMSAGGENGEFGRVMKMTPRDRLLYFFERPEVSRELRKGNARAIFIPLRENGVGWFSRRADNLLLIRADSSLTTASAVVKALKDKGSEKVGTDEVFAQFSPFEQIVDPRSVERLVSRCEERIKSQEELVRRQEEKVGKKEERVRLQEEEARSVESAFEEDVREKKLLENEEHICRIEEQIRTVDDRIRKHAELEVQAHRLDESEEELRTLENRKEVIRSVLDIEKQKQSLEERRKEKLTSPEADEIEKQIRSINDQVRETLGKNSIGRRRVSLPQQLLDLENRTSSLSQQIQRVKSELSKGLPSRDELKSERKQLEDQRQQLLLKRRELASARRQLETCHQKLESERKELESGRRRLESERDELGATRKQAQAEIECLRNGEMIPSRYNLETLPKTLLIALQDLQEHGEIADLVLSSDASGSCVLGITDMVETNNSARDDYERVLKMSPRERMLYFLGRPEVSRELQKGAARAVIIPLQVERWGHVKADNVVLIRVSSELKTGADVVAALKSMDDDCSKKSVRKTMRDESWDDDEDDEDYHREKTRTDGILVQFSPFERAANPQFDDRSVLMLENKIRTLENRMRRQMERIQTQIPQWRRRSAEEQFKSDGIELESLIKKLRSRLKGGEMLPSAYEFGDIYKNHYHIQGARKRVFETIEEHGDISDLIILSDDAGFYVLGVCYVNIYGANERTKYAGPRDYGDRFPKYIIAPDGKVIYELTEEMVLKQMEEERPRPQTKRQPLNQFILSDDDAF